MNTVVIHQNNGTETLEQFPDDFAGTGGSLSGFLVPGKDLSGSTVNGTQTLAPANERRRGLTFQNTSDTEMRLTENGLAASATTGYKIAPGQSVNISTNRAIGLFCAVAGKTYAATEF